MAINDSDNSNKATYPMFQDTTRLRLQIPRPTAKEAFQEGGGSSSQLGRKGISQSFKERMVSPVRPKEPPPPPPPPPSATSSLGRRLLPAAPKRSQTIPEKIYDIAEFDETSEQQQQQQTSRLLPSTNLLTGSLKKLKRASKPPRSSSSSKLAERSRSFINPKTATVVSSPSTSTSAKESKSFFHRSLSQIPKSFNSLDRAAVRKTRSTDQVVVMTGDFRQQSPNPEGDYSRSRMRKILSSPSVSSTTKQRISPSKPPRAREKESSSEHIYEEIPADRSKRPLPPLPAGAARRTSKTDEDDGGSSSRSSESPVKSIFEGATKYDILHYLEDAKERGFTDVEIDDDDDEDEEEEIVVTMVGGDVIESSRRRSTNSKPPTPIQPQQVVCLSPSSSLADRNHANRVSSGSGSSSATSASSSASSATKVVQKPGGGTTVDIERNDSGLGSETSKQRPSVVVRGGGGGLSPPSAATTATSSAASSTLGSGRRRQFRGSYRNRILVDGGSGVGGGGGVLVGGAISVEPQTICEDCDQPITEENSEKDRCGVVVCILYLVIENHLLVHRLC